MRLLALLAIAPVTAFAQDGLLGTKTSAPVQAATGTGGGGLIQTVLAVIVVAVILKVAFPKLLKKFGAPLGHSTGHSLQIEESAGFPGGHLHIVRAGGKRLLVGTTSGSVALLSDLTAEKAEDPPLFSEMVESAPAFTPDLARRLDHLGGLRG